jgi:hypothetical protein
VMLSQIGWIFPLVVLAAVGFVVLRIGFGR